MQFLRVPSWGGACSATSGIASDQVSNPGQSAIHSAVAISNNDDDAKGDPSNLIRRSDVLQILGLLSTSQRSTLGSNALDGIEAGSDWTPDSSAEVKLLPAVWHFPYHARYHRTTTGALEAYSQRMFEIMVTTGYIIKNDKGFRWTANKKHLLLKDT
jgi:hypothetical protein